MAKRKQHMAQNAPGDQSIAGNPSTASTSYARRLLSVILAVYLVLAVAYSAITPAYTDLQHNPDENAHMLYVQSVAHGHLPIFHSGDNAYESHQPPLYYALSAPFYLAAQRQGMATATHDVRYVSIFLGALLILIAYLCVVELFPEEPRFALATAGFIALLPMNVALSASVTNDASANLIIVIALWLMVKIARSSGTSDAPVHKYALRLGVALGLGVWAKTSAILLFPLTVLVFLLIGGYRLMPSATLARIGGTALLLGAAIGSPWLIRNQLLYGDPLAQHLFINSFNSTAKADPMIRFFGSFGTYLSVVAQWTFASFWGVFDSMSLFWGQDPLRHAPSPLKPLGPIYGILAASCVLSPAGLAARLKAAQEQLAAYQKVMLWAFLALILMTFYAFFNFILIFFQAQGRYWYTALLPISFFYLWGWRGLFPRPSQFQIVAGLLLAGLLALNLYTLFGLLLPRFSVH